MLEWPISLAQAFQGFITKENMTDPHILINQFRIKPELLSGSFLDVYFPLQPNLLPTIAVITFLILILIFTVIAVAFTGLARRLHCLSEQLYDVSKDRKNKSKFMLSWSGLLLCWIFLSIGTGIMVTYLLELSSSHVSLDTNNPIVIKPLNKTSDQFVSISLSSITVVNRKWKQSSRFGETDLLNKYNEIREKGYEFRPLETLFDYEIQSLVVGAIIFVFTVILFIMVFVIGIGLREHYHCYHPMERSTSSNMCGLSAKYLSHTLLMVTPVILVIAMVIMTYSQVHNVICPYVQHVVQNQDIESYVNANVMFFDPYNLLDFLNDLSAERADVNQTYCQKFVEPLEGIWVMIAFISFFSLMCSVFLWKISKHLVKVKSKVYLNQTETFGTLRKPVPFGPVISTNRY